MRPWIIKLLIGVIGFGGGFAAGFFCHKKMTDLKFEEISEEEMAEIEKRVAEGEKKEEAAKEASSEKEVEIPDNPKDADDLRNRLQGKKPYIEADAELKRQYDKLWQATKGYSNEENANHIPVAPLAKGESTEALDEAESESPEEDEFGEEFLEQIEREAAEAGNNFVSPPYEVGLPDFYNERPDFDKITIKWFEPDDVWLDEKEQIIGDISSYIGVNMSGKLLFGKPGIDNDPDVRFIRNERYQTDYEVIRHHRSYRETTGG